MAKVLILEDDELLNKTISKFLSNNSFEIESFLMVMRLIMRFVNVF